MQTYKIHFLLFISFILLLGSSKSLQAQEGDQAIRIGLKLPLTYDIGYYKRFSNRIGMHASVQIVTIPFSGVSIGYMNLFGADPNITAILAEPYSIGAGIDHGWHYYFGTDNRRYYGGISAQWMNLLKRDIIDETIDNAFAGEDNGCATLDKCPVNPIQQVAGSKPLTLNTNYVNIGLTFGVIFQLANKDAELRLEGELNKTIFSRHHLQSDYRFITPIADRTNEALQDAMMKYGWFPTLNIYYIYKLNL